MSKVVWPRPRAKPSKTELLTEARLAIAGCLSGGDSAAAWNAVWDLARSDDVAAKRDVLVMLRDYVDNAVDSRTAGREATTYFDDLPHAGSVQTVVDHQWHKIDLACDFEEAILQSLDPSPPGTLPSREVRTMQRREQMARYEAELRRLGVRPGEGLPMWMLYMTRRSKRSHGFTGR